MSEDQHLTDSSSYERPPPETQHDQNNFAGSHIGPYRLLQKIGEGGMGTVWMADQQEPVRRRVALKVIKGGQDSKQIIARFEAERQALAMMNHQNIAQVLDAGTVEDGRPYFAMELVQGVPFTNYCDDNKLTTHQRLDLLIPVCNAIQHAHQKGIIHRDIKPSNILVTLIDGLAVPKVIDFGLAKALQTQTRLTDKTMFTEFGQFVGTLNYMSPEQAEMNSLDVDTRTDIYSLGALLYEVLTSTTPLDRETTLDLAFVEVLSLIREKDPPRPSARLSATSETITSISVKRKSEPTKLLQLLRGDLDWIVMKCLEKDRTRRYATANALAMELERFLEGKPVHARPPSPAYLAGKFVKKNKGLVATCCIVLLTLVIGIASTSWQATLAGRAVKTAEASRVDADEQREEAQSARAQAELVKNEAIATANRESKARDEAERLRQIADGQSQHIQKQLYRSNVTRAQNDFKDSNTALAQSLLEACPAELKAWEWHRLKYMLDRGSRVRRIPGDSNPHFLGEGERLLLVGGHDAPNTIRVWDTTTLECLREISVGDVPLQMCAVSSDERIVAVSGSNGSLTLVDLDSGAFIWAKTSAHVAGQWGQARIDGIDFGPKDEKVATVGFDGMLKIWDVETGSILLEEGPFDALRDVEFGPEGNYLAAASVSIPGMVNPFRIWDVKSGDLVFADDQFGKTIDSIAIHPDGKHIMTACEGRLVARRSFPQGKIIDVQAPNTDRIVNAIELNVDGTKTAAAGEQEVVIWSRSGIENGLREKLDDFRSIYWLKFSRDNRKLAVFGVFVDGGYGVRLLRFADAAMDDDLQLSGFRRRIYSVAFSPDSNQIAAAGEGRTIKVWSCATGQELFSLFGHHSDVLTIIWGKNSSRLYSYDVDGVVHAWDTGLKREIWRRRFSPKSAYQFGQKLSLDDGATSLLVAAGKDVVIVDPGTGEETGRLAGGHAAEVNCVACDSSGKFAVTGGRHRRIVLWDLESKTIIRTMEAQEEVVRGIAFSPDSKTIASAGGLTDCTIKIWNVETGKVLHVLETEQTNAKIWSGPINIHYSPDGKRIFATSDTLGQFLYVWDTSDGAELMRIRKGRTDMSSLSPDGGTFATAGDTGTVTLFETYVPSPATLNQRHVVRKAVEVVDALYRDCEYCHTAEFVLRKNDALTPEVLISALQTNAARGRDPYALASSAFRILLAEDSDRFEDALEFAEEATSLDPDCFEYQVINGLALYRLGRYQAAEEALRSCLELEPNTAFWEPNSTATDLSAACYSILALTEHHLGKNIAANDHLELAIEVYPGDSKSDARIKRFLLEAKEAIAPKGERPEDD